MRKKLDEIGLICNQAHAPFDLRFNEPLSIDCDNYRAIVHAMESAAILGAESIVVHAMDTYDMENIVEFNYEYYKSLEPYCKKFGIKVAIENIFSGPRDEKTGFYSNKRFGTPELLLKIIKMLNSPWFVICVDIGHASLTGYEPQDFIRGLKECPPSILHVQDTDYYNDCHVLPYCGKLNWNEITKSLSEVGYNGELTLEVFGFLDKIDKDLIPKALEYSAATARNIADKIK